jgi:hypothetical protein
MKRKIKLFYLHLLLLKQQANWHIAIEVRGMFLIEIAGVNRGGEDGGK